MAEVVLIRWPEDGEDGVRLAGTGVAVLYLVNGDDVPPAPQTCIEDWVRLPGDERDIGARVEMLQRRAATHDAPPWIDDQGRLHYRGNLVALAPLEARMAAVLAAHFGEIVTDTDLAVAAEGETLLGPSLRTEMSQLRARLRDLGLALHRIRRLGYRLQRV